MLKKKLLITGGLGNLGSWLVDYALEKFDVTVLTRENKKININGSYEVILADITSKSALFTHLNHIPFNYVIHAASMNDGFVEGYADHSYNVNSFGTRNIINALNIDALEHFIYLSTFQVYGSYSGLIDEKSTTKPLNDYGLSHLVAEYFLQSHLREPKFSIIRLTNSYGCPKDINTTKWYLALNDLCRSAVKNHEIKLAGNGKSIRDFIWMGDVSNTLLKLLELAPQNEIYNLSREESISIYDVAKEVQSAFKEYYGDSIKILLNADDMSNPDQTLVVNCSKIKSRVDITYNNKFVDESIEMFKLLTKK